MRYVMFGCVLLLSGCTKEKLEKSYEEPKINSQSWCAYESFQWEELSFNQPIKGVIKNTGTNLHQYFYRINKIDEFYNEYSDLGVLNNNKIILPQLTGGFSHNVINSQDFLGFGVQVYSEYYGECTGIDYLDITQFKITKTEDYWQIDMRAENGEKTPFNGKIKLHFTKNGEVVAIHTLNTSHYGLPANAVLPVTYLVQSHLLKGADSLRVVFSDLGRNEFSDRLLVLAN